MGGGGWGQGWGWEGEQGLPNANFPGRSDGIVQLDIIWVDILIITTGCAAVHDKLSHL